MAEYPVSQSVFDPDGNEYDVEKGEKLAKWAWSLNEHAADHRKTVTNEKNWDRDWSFIGGKQWDGDLPPYRYRVVYNFWRRAIHQAIAVLTGDRPLLKIIPAGKVDQKVLETWQHALWGAIKAQDVMSEYSDALLWAMVADGGWIKIGWGRQGPESEPMDVLCVCRHPKKIFPDSGCSDFRLTKCGYIIDRDAMDLYTITSRFPEQGWRVKPDDEVSGKWASDSESANYGYNDMGPTTIAPAGGWSSNKQYKRARATTVELWIDDPAVEFENYDTEKQLQTGRRGEWIPAYPYGRLITCTKDTVLRDIPNPLGPSLGWARRYPYVYVPGAHQPLSLWRPGMLSDQKELQRAVNKTLSLIVENAIKVTNALIVADDLAMDDEDWDLLTLVPGAKIRKRTATDFKIVFPEALPATAMQLPDQLGQKIEGALGIQDPQLPPGQAVAARTVQFLMTKGNFILGALAGLGDQALARVGQRMLGIMRKNYLPSRQIPFFEGERLIDIAPLGELPPTLEMRVEPSAAMPELMASMASMAQQEASKRK